MIRLRLFLLSAIFFLGFGAVIFRAFQLQLLPRRQVERLASRQFKQRLEIVGRRGSIVDRTGRELAVSTNSVSIFANPQLVKSRERVSRVLGRILDMDELVIKDKLKAGNGKKFVWIARQLDVPQMAKLEKIDIKTLAGIGVLPEYRREYPQASLAGHVLGFVSVDGKGLEGIEKTFDDDLAGDRNAMILNRDALGRPIFGQDDQIRLDLGQGKRVELSIDSKLQYSAEKAVKEAIDRHQAEAGVAIVMNPYTGEILALASLPAFDPNAPRSSMGNIRNRALTDPFEPGSVVKPFVVARAIEDRIVTPQTKIDAGHGFIKVGRKTIGEADAKHRFARISITDLIRVSSNVGTVALQQKMGFPRIEDTFRRVGFGSLLGIELGGESRGIFNSPKPGQILEQATMSFGQGFSATALQMASAYSVFANGGFRVKPTVLKTAAPVEPKESDRIFSLKTVVTMRKILEKVVEEEGTGTQAKVERFHVAGKTGTAQRVDYGHGGYERGAYWSSFAGFLPADNPRFVIYVMIDHPTKNGVYGGEVAAPAFAQIAQAALRFIPAGDDEAAPALAAGEAAPGVAGEAVSEAPADAPALAPSVVKIAPRSRAEAKRLRKKTRLQAARATDPAVAGSVPAAIPGGSGVVPELAGLPLSQALRLLKSYGLKMSIVGEGDHVAEQMPGAGTKADSDTTIYLKLR